MGRRKEGKKEEREEGRLSHQIFGVERKFGSSALELCAVSIKA